MAATEDEILYIGAAAEVARVSKDTLRRWADEGKVPSIRTPSGQRKFRRGDMEAVNRFPDEVAEGVA